MLSYNKSIIPIIESSYEDLTNVEKMIADYFLNGVENDELSSKDVSKKLFVSEASLSRFAKKLGFSGYREFQFAYKLAEILVIDGQRPVVRLIGFVELRFKVERIKIGVTGIHPARADHILGVVRSQPCIQNIGGEVREIRFIALEHLRRNGVHLFVIGLLDGVDEHIVLIPVIGVLRHDAASLRLKRGKDICAVIEQLGVVCSEHISLQGETGSQNAQGDPRPGEQKSRS